MKHTLYILILVLLCSCVMDRKMSFYIKNCTTDTLLIDLNDTDTIDIVICTYGYIQPDSIQMVSPYLFKLSDTCYLYTIKKQVMKNYSLKEISNRKLYDKRAVTIENFDDNHLYEYKRN
jgi:hypothetical protein